MKAGIHTQEILILPDSTLFSKQIEQIESNPEKKCTPNEILANACWDGILFEILPEISSLLYLSEINETASFLELKYGEFSVSVDKTCSINPYHILENSCNN